MADEKPPEDKQTCAVCGKPITITDTEGGNLHCQQGHVVAIDHAEHPFGPVSRQMIDKLIDAAKPKPVEPPAKTE